MSETITTKQTGTPHYFIMLHFKTMSQCTRFNNKFKFVFEFIVLIYFVINNIYIYSKYFTNIITLNKKWFTVIKKIKLRKTET